MNTDQGRLYLATGIDNSKLRSDAAESRNILHSIGTTAQREGANMDNALLKVGKTLGAVFAVGQLKQFASQIVSLRSEIQKLEISFQTLAGKTKGDALFKDIREFAVQTPMMMKDLAQGAQTMLAFNIEAEKVMPILRAIGDISMGDAQKFNSLALAFSQMSATGKLMGQDLLQMINAGFNPLSVISDKTGKSIGELKEQMEAGKISTQMVTQAFMDATSEGGKFYGMLQSQAEGIAGAQAQFNGAFDDMMNAIGKSTESTVVSMLQTSTELAEHYEQVGRILLGVIATYGTYRAALMAVTAAQGWATAAEALHYHWLLLVEKAQKALNATMLTNPYVLVATLIAGVVAALISMKTETELLKEKEEEYEEQKRKTIEKEQEHQREIEKLCSVSGDEAVATDTRRAALYQLEKKYPDIFAKYDTEFEKLSNLKKIKEEIAALDAKNSITNTNNELDAVTKRINELEAKAKTARTELDMTGGRFGVDMRTRVVDGLSSDEERELKMLRQKQKALSEQSRKESVDAYFVNLTGVSNEDLAKMIQQRKNLLAQIKLQEVNGKTANGRIVGEGNLNGVYSKEELQAQEQALTRELNYRNADTKSGAEWLAAKKKAYLDAQKALNDYINSSKTVREADYDKEVARLRAEMDTAKKEYEKYKPATDSESKSAASKANQEEKKANHTSVEIAERNQAIEEAKNAEIKATRDAMLQVRQERLNLQKESVDKTLEQIAIDKERMENALEDREKDLLEKYRDVVEKQWQNDNPDAKDKGISFDRTSVTMDDLRAAALDENNAWLRDAIAAIEASRQLMNETITKETNDAYDGMLQEVLTYEQQRLKIEEEYARKRNDFYEKNADGSIKTDADGNKVYRSGVTQGNLDELNRQETEALKAVDEQFAQREDTYQAWCNQIANLSLKQLNAVLEEAKKNLEELEKNGSASPQELAQARAKVNTAQEAVNKAEADNQANPGKRTIKEWEDLYKTLNDVEQEFESIGDTVGGVVGDIISECGQFASSALKMINGIVQLTQMSSTSITATAKVGASAISSLEKASVILTVISAAMSIATQISSLFNNDEKKQKEIDRLQSRIDQLQWELDHQDVGRVQAQYGTAIERLNKALQQSRIELAASQNVWQRIAIMTGRASRNQDLMLRTAEKLATAYGTMSYTVDKALGAEKYQSAQEQLKNLAQQQILIQEQIKAESSKKKSDKGAIQEWQNKIEELGQQAIEVINEMVEDIIGDTSTGIAEELMGAFIDAFKAGEDAAVAWGDKVNDIVADIMQRMLVSKFLEEPLGEIFNQYKAKWFKGGQFQGLDAVISSMQGFANDLNAVGSDFAQIWENLPDSVKQMFTITSDAEHEASQKGIATASQESVDELNGRATAIQSHTYSISENTKLLLANTANILASLQRIEGHTESMATRLNNIETGLREVSDALNDLSLKGIKLKN